MYDLASKVSVRRDLSVQSNALLVKLFRDHLEAGANRALVQADNELAVYKEGVRLSHRSEYIRKLRKGTRWDSPQSWEEIFFVTLPNSTCSGKSVKESPLALDDGLKRCTGKPLSKKKPTQIVRKYTP